MRSLLAHRYWPLATVLLGMLCMLFSVDTGLSADDWLLQYAINGGTPLPWSPLGSAGLPSPSDSAQVLEARNLGLLPWTADANFRFAFLRPLSLATHLVDFRLWPSHPWLMHLHSVAWFGLFLAGAAALVRRVEGAGWAAGLALLILALDDTHGPAVGWIANRNLVMAAAFGAWSLWFADRERDGGSALWSPLLLLLALTSNEGALGWWPLFLGHAIFVDPSEGRWRRLAVLTALCVGWVGLWAGLGFGVHGSGVYGDLSADPFGALVQLLTNAPLLLLSLLAGVWAEIFSLGGFRFFAFGVAAGVVCALVAVVVGVRLARQDRRVAMWLLGLFGAVLPVSMSFPSDRLLLIASLPAAVLLAKLVEHLRTDRRAYKLAAVVAAALLIRHVGLNLLFAPLRARSMEAPQDMVERGTASLDLDRAEGDVVVLVNPPSDAMAAYAVTLRAARFQSLPQNIVSLYSGIGAVEVERVDADTLVLRPEEPWMAVASERLSRDLDVHPFSAGATVTVPGLTLTVEATTDDGRPARVRADFDAPLEDARYHWFRYDVIDFTPWSVPEPGQSELLPPTDAAAAYFGVDDERS